MAGSGHGAPEVAPLANAGASVEHPVDPRAETFESAYGPLDMRATNHLFQLVSARHRLAPTLVAANTGFSQWKTLFPSEAQAVATVDRPIDNATILHFTGKSHRRPQDGNVSDDGD